MWTVICLHPEQTQDMLLWWFSTGTCFLSYKAATHTQHLFDFLFHTLPRPHPRRHGAFPFWVQVAVWWMAAGWCRGGLCVLCHSRPFKEAGQPWVPCSLCSVFHCFHCSSPAAWLKLLPVKHGGGWAAWLNAQQHSCRMRRLRRESYWFEYSLFSSKLSACLCECVCVCARACVSVLARLPVGNLCACLDDVCLEEGLYALANVFLPVSL